MKLFERVFGSEALVKGWKSIGPHRTWWFDLSQVYHKQYSLDGKGTPIYWDDEVFETQVTRDATVDDTCTAVLSSKNKKAIIIINRHMDHVEIQGSVFHEVSWEDYNRLGLWAVKKHCPGYQLEAVIINPTMKTLKKYKVVKAIINKVVEMENLIKAKEKSDEHAEGADTANQTNPAAA